MGYFRELPNLRYPSFLKEKKSSLDYIEVKNVFRRIKLRDDLQNNFTIFEKYEIEEGGRPDTIAEELYGNPEFDWIVLTVAGILNVRNEWPLSNHDLYNYAEEKYGESLNSVRFFETKEVKDSKNRVVLEKGKIVNQDFKLFYYDDLVNNTDVFLKTLSNFVGVKIINKKLQQFKVNEIRYKDHIIGLHKIRVDSIKRQNYNIHDYLPEDIIEKYDVDLLL